MFSSVIISYTTLFPGREYPEQLILDCVEFANDNWKNEYKDFGSGYRKIKKTKCIEGNMKSRVWHHPPIGGQVTRES